MFLISLHVHFKIKQLARNILKKKLMQTNQVDDLGSTYTLFRVLYLCGIHVKLVSYQSFHVIIFQKLLVSPCSARVRVRVHAS